MDLADEIAVKRTILREESKTAHLKSPTLQPIDLLSVDIVIHTASSYDTILESHLIKALGERRKLSGNATYFIHVGW